jgi:hypothetical protein
MTNAEELLPWKMFSAYVRGVKAPIESAMARRPGIDFNIVLTPLRGYPYEQWNSPTSATTAGAEIIPVNLRGYGRHERRKGYTGLRR